MDKTSLGSRIKSYEDIWRQKIVPRTPVIVRIDGKAFHSLTKQEKFQRPYDYNFRNAFDGIAYNILNEVSTARFAYAQSDEISFLLIDYNKYNTQQYVDGNIQKMASICASMASSAFTLTFMRSCAFDGRVFCLPKNEIINYFIWRQQDAIRNSIQMLARCYFSHNECLNKSCEELQEMLFSQKGINFNDYPVWFKRGRVIRKKERPIVDDQIPVFTKNREYLEQYMKVEEE